MSVKVAVVCENPTYDRYIAKPVVEFVLRSLGKPRARVNVVVDPATRSDYDLVALACDVLERYGPVSDAVVFITDLDCEDGRGGHPDKALRLRNAVCQCEFNDRAVVVGAVQEIEVWALWGVRAQLGVPWADVRSDCDPKERFFEPLLTRSDELRVDGGRTRLVAASAAPGWASFAGGCPELTELRASLAELI